MIKRQKEFRLYIEELKKIKTIKVAFEHGDVNTKNSLLVYSMEYPRQWGKTLYRTLYTGHYHHKKKIEYITEHEKTGFMLKILPSLSRTDYYHYHNKSSKSYKYCC
jgi:hypothetical protein